MHGRLVALLLGFAGAVAVGADEFEGYPQFRYISGLPGGGYAVDPDGYVGFDGALQMNVPVAYTPAAGSYVVSYHSSAINGGIEISFGGDDANGTGTFAAGCGPEGHGLYLAAMLTGKGNGGEAAYNLQYQILSETDSRPALAIGVVDILNMRPERQSDIFGGGGRSFYLAATRGYPDARYPSYWTVGVGDGRFNDHPFAGVCVEVSPRVKLAAEYDGWNVNAGAAWDAWHTDRWHAIVLAGLTDLDRWTVGATLTRGPD